MTDITYITKQKFSEIINIDYKDINTKQFNQKIYHKYFGFEDFQMIMIAPSGTETEIEKMIVELNRITEDMKGWKFVFTTPDEIERYYDSFHFKTALDVTKGTSQVFILDKNKK